MDKYKTMVSYSELMRMFDEIESKDALRTSGYILNAGSLFKFIYGCYGRVCEVVNPRYNMDTGRLGHENFEVRDKWVLVSLITEKTGKLRTVFISRRKQPSLCNSLISFVEKSKVGEPFFDVSYRWVERKFKLYFPFVQHGENVHLLRHWAATHYLQGFHTVEKPKVEHLALLGGWDSFNVLWNTYQHLLLENVKDQI